MSKITSASLLEEFVKMENYPKYEISKSGTIRTIKSKKIRKPYLDKNSSMLVMSMHDASNKMKRKQVATLVLTIFKPEITMNTFRKNYIIFVDKNRLNTKLENLTIGPKTAINRAKAGLNRPRKKYVKLDPQERATLKSKIKEGNPATYLAKTFKVSVSMIRKLKQTLKQESSSVHL